MEFWQEDDFIKLEKYYILKDYEFHAKLLAESVSDLINYHVYIVDREYVLAYAGKHGEGMVNKKISDDLLHMLDQRATHIIQGDKDRSVAIVDDRHIEYLFLSQIISPIFFDNAVIGGVIFEAEAYNMEITELEKKFMEFTITMLQKIVV
jgi:hypothetical protein